MVHLDKIMNNSDLRIIFINREQKTKYQQTISVMRKSRNDLHRVETQFSENLVFCYARVFG